MTHPSRVTRWLAALATAVVTTSIAQLAVAESEPKADTLARAADPAPPHLGSVFVDPLGVALFGPRIGIEGGSGAWSVAATARWFNLGLLGRSLFLSSGYEFDFSYGLGLRGRYYLADGMSGTHLGASAEYLNVHARNSSLLIATRSQYFIPYAEAGYRLPFGGWYADGSAGFGYALRVASSTEDLPGGNFAASYQVTDKSSVYGTASLDVGLYF